jgi:lysozyme family protein
MNENYDKIIDFVLSWEGWRSDDEHDPGGRTVWGIAARFYPREVALMWEMTEEDAKEYAKGIYRRDYWNKVNGDNLVTGTDALIFDTCVNMGMAFAKSLQQYDTMTGIMKRIERYTDIASHGNNIKFLRGWIRRVISLYAFIKKLEE